MGAHRVSVASAADRSSAKSEREVLFAVQAITGGIIEASVHDMSAVIASSMSLGDCSRESSSILPIPGPSKSSFAFADLAHEQRLI